MTPETLDAFTRYTAIVTEAVVTPFVVFLHRDSVFYWPYLLSALAIAVALYAWTARRRGGSTRTALAGYFNKRIWWHRSAKVDYRYHLLNGMIWPAVFFPFLVTGAAIGVETRTFLEWVFGTIDAPLAVGTTATVAYSITFFLAYDFGRYCGHSLQHNVPFLWQFHKVHHSAEVLTPATSSRAHPVDLAVMALCGNIGIGLATGPFLYFFGGEVGLVTFLKLHIALFAYQLVANLRHSHVWLSYGPVLGRLFISPAQHQIHHSTNPAHFGKNRGFGLAIWDWMFGTLYVTGPEEKLEFGLGDGTEPRYRAAWRLYLVPFKDAFSYLRSRAGSAG